MWEDDGTISRTDPEGFQPYPIADDAWPEEALLATLPPSEVAIWRAARRQEAGR